MTKTPHQCQESVINMESRIYQKYKDEGIQSIRHESEFWVHERLGRYIPYYPTLLRNKLKIKREIFGDKFTDSDPLKIIWIDPDEITRSVIGGPRMFGRVESGNWDQDSSRFLDSCRASSIYDHFMNNVSWKETKYFQKEVSLLEERGIARYGCKSVDEILSRLQGVDELYIKIRSNGYQTQRELLRTNPKTTLEKNKDAPHPLCNEIGVNLTRDGDFVFSRCGIHRLVIAKVLELDEVPVQVRVRHSKWQQVRNRHQAREKACFDYSHPDLYDLKR